MKVLIMFCRVGSLANIEENSSTLTIMPNSFPTGVYCRAILHKQFFEQNSRSCLPNSDGPELPNDLDMEIPKETANNLQYIAGVIEVKIAANS